MVPSEQELSASFPCFFQITGYRLQGEVHREVIFKSRLKYSIGYWTLSSNLWISSGFTNSFICSMKSLRFPNDIKLCQVVKRDLKIKDRPQHCRKAVSYIQDWINPHWSIIPSGGFPELVFPGVPTYGLILRNVYNIHSLLFIVLSDDTNNVDTTHPKY